MARGASLPFSLTYWFIAAVNGLPAALGLCFPFGILGDSTPFFDPAVAADVQDLLVVHCARMSFGLALTLAAVLVALCREELRLRAKLLLLSCLGTLAYATGELVWDRQAAARLQLDLDSEAHPRAVQFLVGALHGNTPHVIVGVAALCAAVAARELVHAGKERKPHTS